MVKAVIFDVDGTLLNTERIYIQAWKEAGAQAGFDVPQDVLLRTRAIHKADAIKIFQEALGPTFDYDALHPVRTAISEAIIAQSTDLLLPGVKEALEALKAKGYPMAVASSTGYEKTAEHLEHAGLLHYFDAVVGGDMVARGKPNPDMLIMISEKMGIPLEKIAMLGDSYVDVAMAKAAGSVGIGIPEEDITKIFNRFYRVDKARSRAKGGTGLGLSIVRDTVRRYGGWVTAAANSPAGSVFTVGFPRYEPEQEEPV